MVSSEYSTVLMQVSQVELYSVVPSCPPPLWEEKPLRCQSQNCPQARDAGRIRRTPKLSQTSVTCRQLMREVFRTHRTVFSGRRVLLLMLFRVGLFSFIL